jgi:hypothetical protein
MRVKGPQVVDNYSRFQWGRVALVGLSWEIQKRIERRVKTTIDTSPIRVYVRGMLKRSNVFLDTKILKELEAIGKTIGLKTAQVIRLALAEFVKARKKEGK